MTQHTSLSPERWADFATDQQLLMIANEMNRAARFMKPESSGHLQRCYERVLRLVDLTVEVNQSHSLRRELLRWRDLVAALYVGESSPVEGHAAAFRALLLLTPETARQIPFVLDPARQ